MSDRQITVYQDEAGEWRWTKAATRGNLPDETVADSAEGYSSKSSAIEAAKIEGGDGTPVRIDEGGGNFKDVGEA